MKRQLVLSPYFCEPPLAKMSRLIKPLLSPAPKQESMMVVWTDGKPTTVIKAKTVEVEPKSLPFQYKIPLSKYNTLTHAAHHSKRRSTQSREPEASRSENNGNEIYPRKPGCVFCASSALTAIYKEFNMFYYHQLWFYLIQ